MPRPDQRTTSRRNNGPPEPQIRQDGRSLRSPVGDQMKSSSAQQSKAEAIYAQANFNNAQGKLIRIAAMMRDYADKMERYAKDMANCPKDGEGNFISQPSDCFNWAINDVENLFRNINFSELARLQARLGG